MEKSPLCGMLKGTLLCGETDGHEKQPEKIYGFWILTFELGEMPYASQKSRLYAHRYKQCPSESQSS